MDHAGRRERTRQELAAQGLVGPLFVTDLANVRYLSGFTGSNAVLVVGRHAGDDVLATDGRYVDQAAQESPGLELLIDRSTLQAVLDRIRPQKVLIESHADLSTLRTCQGAGAVVSEAPGIVESLRAIKDADEIEVLTRACAITSEAVERLLGEVRVGDSELLLARRLEQIFAELGAEDRAFPSIVAAGDHTAIPHHQPTLRTVQQGDLLLIDSGARVAGYHADMTRTVVVGRVPDSWQSDIHAAVLQAQEAGLSAAILGETGAGIDGAARRQMGAAGLGERFTHGLGHGVGLRIHEAPGINCRDTGSIRRDMAFTVEPGAYLPGRGGVRIEDTLVVCDPGPRVLTTSPRELRVVGA